MCEWDLQLHVRKGCGPWKWNMNPSAWEMNFRGRLKICILNCSLLVKRGMDGFVSFVGRSADVTCFRHFGYFWASRLDPNLAPDPVSLSYVCFKLGGLTTFDAGGQTSGSRV